MKYYDKINRAEVKAADITDKDGKIARPFGVVELAEDNPFFSPTPVGKRLTYDSKGVPNGLESKPRYYHTVGKNEVLTAGITDKKGAVILPGHVVELAEDNPFFSPTPVGKRLTYDSKGVPNGLEDVPAIPAAVILAGKEGAYYAECYAYQLANIDANLLDEMSKSESLVEAGRALEADLPLAKGDGDWLESLWTFYYTEKDAGSYSLDFAGAIGSVPDNHASVRSERKTFLAGL